MVRSLILAAALFGSVGLAPDAAVAGSPYYGQAVRANERPDPAASGVPGIPNLQGCVKRCERDMNPCDPPIYKQVDGRCNYFN